MSSSAGPVGAVAEPPEVEDAVEAVAAVAGAPRKGQGPQMSPAVRKAIEMHAMAQAATHYADRGWGVKDVSARESYDLLCQKDGKDDLRVEVKGTTSAGHAVLLTRKEVANAKAQHPNVALVVVSHIRVDRTALPPTASGGQLRVDDPWSLVETALEPLAFSYELPAH